MIEQKYKEDLKEIKDIMNRSSRFISLSGISGVAAGTIALTGAYAAYRMVYVGQGYMDYGKADVPMDRLWVLFSIAAVTIIAAVLAVIYFTSREARKQNEKLWDLHTRRLLFNLAIPLTTGGILGLIFLFKGYVGVVAPLTLVFYGLALVNASKYTLGEIRSLGLVEIGLGLMGVYFIGYGLWFWVAGFGLLHIVYGIAMYMRRGS